MMYLINYWKISTFLVYVKEIQDHLLGEIKPEDKSEKCLLESCKIESKIKQRKLLGLKTTMIYDAIHEGFCGRNKSHSKRRNHSSSSSGRNCKYCGKSHSQGNCTTFEKKCQNVANITTLKLYVRVIMLTWINVIQAAPGQEKGKGQEIP